MDYRQHPKFDAFTAALEDDRGLPRGVLKALVSAESSGNADAVSPVGAQGLTQFMPATAKQYNVDVSNPWDSLRGTSDYLADLMKKYDGNINAALSHYNGGAHNAKFQVDGTVPDASRVSAKNHEVNKAYVKKITGQMEPSGVTYGELNDAVADLASKGAAPITILEALAKNPAVAPLVRSGEKKGLSPEEIVARLGGERYAEVSKARAEVKAQSFLGNVVKGAGNAGSDLLLGARQIAASPDQVEGLREEARRRQADPRRQAVSETAGGVTGEIGTKALPAVAAAFVPGGLPTMIGAQAAAGAATGALEPTTEDGERARNTLLGGVVGGGTMGAVGAGGKLLSKTAAKVLARDPAKVAEAQRLADAARAQGLPVNVATITEGGKQLAEALPGNASIRAMQANADDVIASKIAEGLGLQGYKGAIDTNLLNTARPAIKQALDDATNMTVSLPQGLKVELDALVNGANNPLTRGIAGDTTVRQATTNVIKAIDDGTAVSGRQLQDLVSELKGVASNMGASASERQTAGQMVGKLNKALTDAMTPEQAAKFNAANRQWANLKAAEKMVSASGDTGVVTPRQVLNAVKTGRFKNAFLRDEAPFQELGRTAADLLGPANGKGLGSIIGKAVGTGDSVLGAASILEPTTGVPLLAGKKLAELITGRLATSENPTIVRALTGIDGGVKGIDPVVRKYIAKALGAGLSTSAR